MNIVVDTKHFENTEILVIRLKEDELILFDMHAVGLTLLNRDHCLNVDLFRKSKIILREEEFKYGTSSEIEDDITRNFKDHLDSENYNKLSKELNSILPRGNKV